MSDITSKLQGAFTGYKGGKVFRLSNGQAWQQSRYKYKYKYKYRPRARLYREGSKWFLHPECMDEPVEVRRVSVLAEGQVVSDFKGFSGDSVFELTDGTIWEEAEYKYEYHYAYRPDAVVVDGASGIEIHIEGMSQGNRVRPGYRR